jgi:ABC-type bacteriocin/lantibiotic exporter with double-glycine peptidase domain
MVFDHYAIDRPLSEFERDLLDRPTGTSMLRLKEVAESCGLRAEGLRVSESELVGIPVPSIALLNNKHYVVIESIESSNAIIYADPIIGRIRMPVERFWLKSNGILLVISKQ